ncbi:MAG TPA: tetratricopeptide repeat protein [Acidimicrobiia bacterium]|nr:tetratricopeptide repeat protein [Acidimicrobiia bacterium]
MSDNGTMEARLSGAVAARESGRLEEAREALLALVAEFPDEPTVNLQCAWAHDRLGLETEAIPFYEHAIDLGLAGEDLQDALLGLGSTYRSIGRYPEALRTLDRGVAEFPNDQGMKIFHAMALYNNGLAKQACESLLTVLASTTQEDGIARYQRAIAEYAVDLDRSWA